MKLVSSVMEDLLLVASVGGSSFVTSAWEAMAYPSLDLLGTSS
jgi:hypothetical protein